MPANRGEWHDYLTPGARKAFKEEYPTLPAQYPSIFTVETSQRAFEEELISAGLGTVPVKPEGQDIALDKPQPLGKVRFTHRTFGLGYEATQELVEDDLYGAVVPPSSRFLAAALRDAEERTAAAVLNLAFTTQTSYDGVALISTAHDTLGGSNSNRPAADVDLSITGMQAALEHFMTLESERGLKSFQFTPQRLIHAPGDTWLAQEILRSEQKPFTANNEINVMRDELTPFMYKYLTDADAWFVTTSDHGLRFYWRRKPRFDNAYDEFAQVAAYFTHARFSAGAMDWHGIWGTVGA